MSTECPAARPACLHLAVIRQAMSALLPGMCRVVGPNHFEHIRFIQVWFPVCIWIACDGGHLENLLSRRSMHNIQHEQACFAIAIQSNECFMNLLC